METCRCLQKAVHPEVFKIGRASAVVYLFPSNKESLGGFIFSWLELNEVNSAYDHIWKINNIEKNG